MSLVISSPNCKIKNVVEIHSVLGILDKSNITIMPEKSIDVFLQANEIPSNPLNLDNFGSNLLSKCCLLYKAENEPQRVYFAFNFGNPFIEVFDMKY